MLELVFTVCSVLEGATCRELSPMPLQEPSTMIGCAIASQVEGAKWVSLHPNHYIQKATCRPVERHAHARTEVRMCERKDFIPAS